MGLEDLSCLQQASFSLPGQENRLNSPWLTVLTSLGRGGGMGGGEGSRQNPALAKLVLTPEADSAEVTGSPSLQYLGHF